MSRRSQQTVMINENNKHSKKKNNAVKYNTQSRLRYTYGEVTSQNLWPRYDRHFVGITRHNVWS